MNFRDRSSRDNWYRTVAGSTTSQWNESQIKPKPLSEKVQETFSKDEIGDGQLFDDTDVLIVSALSDEHKAIKRSIFLNVNTRDEQRGGQFFTVGEFQTREGSLTISTCCFSQMGMVSAAISTTRAMLSLRLRLVIIGGICAGIKGKTKVGDLVIGSDIFNHESKKRRKSGDQADYPTLPIHWDIQNALNALLEQDDFLKEIESYWPVNTSRPDYKLDAHVAPFASGSSVVADPNVMGEMKDHQRRVLALDMEVYGVAKAVHFNSYTKFLAVKSVSDFGDEDKEGEVNPHDAYREYCYTMSAAFIRVMLQRISYKTLTQPPE